MMMAHGTRFRVCLAKEKAVSWFIDLDSRLACSRACFGWFRSGKKDPFYLLGCFSLSKYYESHNNCPRFSSRRPHFVLTLSSLRPHRGHFCNRFFTLLWFFPPVLFTFDPMNLHIHFPVPQSLPHSCPAPLSLLLSVYTAYFNFSRSDAYWVGGK